METYLVHRPEESKLLRGWFSPNWSIFSRVLIKPPTCIYIETEKCILKYIQKSKVHRIQRNFENKKWGWRIYTTWSEALYSKCGIMKPMQYRYKHRQINQWNKIESRNRTIHIQSIF